jgi:hypothetical protein
MGELWLKLPNLLLWLSFFPSFLLQWTCKTFYILFILPLLQHIFVSFSYYLRYFVHNMLSHFSYILLFSYFIKIWVNCFQDFDCAKHTCLSYLTSRCKKKIHKCLRYDMSIVDYVPTWYKHPTWIIHELSCILR